MRGWIFLNDNSFSKYPSWVGSGMMDNDATIPQRRSVADAKVRHKFRRLYPNFESKACVTVHRMRDGPWMYKSFSVVEQFFAEFPSDVLPENLKPISRKCDHYQKENYKYWLPPNQRLIQRRGTTEDT